MEQIAELASTLGFPIVMAGAMAWYINKQEERHREEMESVKLALDQNSKVIVELNTMVSMIWKQITGSDD